MIAYATPRPGRRKRLLLVKPSAYDARGRLIRGRRAFFPSRTMPYLAALTPEHWDVRLVDDSVQPVPTGADVDLVAMTGMLTNMPRAMDLARACRDAGTPVAIGGIGVWSLKDRLIRSGCFDTIIGGEAETVWPEVLMDAADGRLRPRYEGGRCPDLTGLPDARYNLVDLGRYVRAPGARQPFLCVETSRGCPHACTFCGVSLFFGRDVRYRPVGDVVGELRRLGAPYYILTDDNIMADPDRAGELFAAMRPLGVRWGGQFSVTAARRPDVLRLAGRSGCRHAVVGVESLLAENLRGVNKAQNAAVPIEDLVATFHEAGIAVTASLIFGLDHDTPEGIDATIDRLLASGVDFILPWTLTPGPGSALFDTMKAEGRLLHENVSLYNGVDVVFRPARMTPEELRFAYWRGIRRFYTVGGALRRAWTGPRWVDALGLNLYFWHVLRRGRHPFTSAV